MAKYRNHRTHVRNIFVNEFSEYGQPVYYLTNSKKNHKEERVGKIFPTDDEIQFFAEWTEELA